MKYCFTSNENDELPFLNSRKCHFILSETVKQNETFGFFLSCAIIFFKLFYLTEKAGFRPMQNKVE